MNRDQEPVLNLANLQQSIKDLGNVAEMTAEQIEAVNEKLQEFAATTTKNSPERRPGLLGSSLIRMQVRRNARNACARKTKSPQYRLDTQAANGHGPSARQLWENMLNTRKAAAK
jgi:hypothetical protein